MSRVYINPQYFLINTKECSYIVSKATFVHEERKGISGFIGILPPMVGYILYNIDGKNLELAESQISDEMSLSIKSIDNFIKRLLNNPEQVGWKYHGHTISFPPYFLISDLDVVRARKIQTEDFSPFEDFIPHRPRVPFSVNFMITTKCYTNCIYCYADRNRIDDLSIDEILHVLDEAYNIGVLNLVLSGGDVFAFPEWKKIIAKLGNYNYSSILSTKVPLSREDICFLKEIGKIESLQISLDSIVPETLRTLLHVNDDYLGKMQKMLEYCYNIGIKVNIRTVLTKYNANIQEMCKLYNFIISQKSVVSWVLTPAFYSAFKHDYCNYRASDNDLIEVYKFTQKQLGRTHLQIRYNKMSDKKYSLRIYSDVHEFVGDNQICNANTYSVAILSNGYVTICEMLYDSPPFILGNIRQQSLYNIWNSSRALKLFSYHQWMIKHKENNNCVKCKVFDECKSGLGKRICYSDIVKVYGSDRFEYPDPRCPESLKIDQEIIL